MKKILFFIPLVLAVLADCEKEVVEDDPIRMDPDHLTYVEEGVRLIAGAEQSRVSFELQPGEGEGTYVASKMAWEVGDIIKVWYNGKIRRFVTNTAGAQGNFNPCTPYDVITRGEFDGSKTLIAYYNISSDDIDKETGNASFTIAANQTEGELSNKVPLYAYIPKAKVEYDQVLITFKPMASVVDFSVSAAARTKDGLGNEVLSYTHEGFTYKLKKVVLEPNDAAGASGWTVGTCTFNPSTGAVTPADDEDRSAITFNFADTTNIAVDGGRHFQMIIGECRLNNSGATMRWYKRGDDPNYVKSIWGSKDIDLTDGHKYLFQGINPKAVGLYDYDDYITKFYTDRSRQENYIDFCDDERKILLTGDIDMSTGVLRYNQDLGWSFNGNHHYLYNISVTESNRITYLFYRINDSNVVFENVNIGGKSVGDASFSITDNNSGGSFGLFQGLYAGTIKDVVSCIDWNLTVNEEIAGNNVYLGSIVGSMNGGIIRNCENRGRLTLTVGTTTSVPTVVGGIAANTGTSLVTIIDSKNYAPISVSGDFSGPIYVSGILGANYQGSSLSGCENHGNVTLVNRSELTSSYVKAAGIVANYGSSSTHRISDCTNFGTIDATAIGAISSYQVAGIMANCPENCTVSGCVQRGNVYARRGPAVDDEYPFYDEAACWFAAWVVGNISSATVLLGTYRNSTQITARNYADRNTWARNDDPGTLSYISE